MNPLQEEKGRNTLPRRFGKDFKNENRDASVPC